MKIARFFAVIFGCLGCVVLLGSILLCLFSLNAPVRVLERPQKAVEVSEAFAEALNSGDLTAAARLIYGQPDLGAKGTPADPEAAAVWAAYLESIAFEYTEAYQAAEQGLTRKASLTQLDVSAVLEALPDRTQALVDQRIAAAEDISAVYDEEGHFREELVTQILEEALAQAIAQDGKPVTREVTVTLIRRDGGWWVVPDQALLQALTGLA